MLFMKKIKKQENKAKTKNRIIITLTVVCFLAMGSFMYIKKKNNIDGLPTGDEININTLIYYSAIEEAPTCDDYRLYGDDNNSNEFVKMYTAYYFPEENDPDVISYDYITKLTWRINLDKDDLKKYEDENSFLANNLGSHFSSTPQDYGEENYWLAVSYDYSSETPTATYDINFKSTDLNMNDKGFQEAIRYFDLECLYVKHFNAFSETNWDEKLLYYHPPFKHLLGSFENFDYDKQGCAW